MRESPRAPTEWHAPTLAAGGRPAPAWCPCCNRRTTTDMLNPITTLPLAVTGGRTAWCDGCREAAFRSGAITREAYYRALGAPAAVLARLTADSSGPAGNPLLRGGAPRV